MESTPQEEAEGQSIVRVLAVVLERLVSANSHLEASQQEETKFHALRAPAIGILQYLERIHKYASCSKECFILALIYIDRLIQRNNFLLTDLNVHRVVITSILLAAKFFDDAYYNNAYYAKVGGVLVSEMNTLEVEFLFKIDFSLRVLPEVFEKYNAELVAHSSAMGLDRISHCTDEELFRVPQQRQQQQQQQQHVPCQHHAPSQAPLLQTYSQAELDQVEYSNNPALAAAPSEGYAPSHYPIQALHQSVTATAAPQAQVITQQQQQQQQQTAAHDPVFPFPTLAHQVSEAAVTPGVAPQDVPLSQYSHHSMTNAAPQAQDYTTAQADMNQQVFYSPAPPMDGGSSSQSHFPSQQVAPATQAPVYSHYFNNGTVQQQQQQQATSTQHHHPSMLQSHPEITPSPPPPQQPSMNIHGAPNITFPSNGDVGMGGCAHLNLSSSVAYLKSTTTTPTTTVAGAAHQQHHHHHYPTPTDAALDLHHHTQHHHHHHQQQQQQQLLPSRPIAIQRPNCTSQYIPQDNISGSWTSRFSFGMGVATSPS